MTKHNDPLSIQLQQAEPHIADGGFTDAVLTRLARCTATGFRTVPPLPNLPPYARALAVAVTCLGSVIAALGLRDAQLANLEMLAPALSLSAVPPSQWVLLVGAGWVGALVISGITLLKLR